MTTENNVNAICVDKYKTLSNNCDLRTNKRNITIDFLKSIATIMVVFIHSANIFEYAAQSIPSCFRPFSSMMSCAVPIFMIVSSFLLFSKKRSLNAVLTKSIKRLLLPYFIWNIGYIVVLSSIGLDADGVCYTWSAKKWFAALFGIPFTQSVPYYNPLWYVRNLFVLSLFVPSLYEPLKKHPHFMSGIAAAVWFSSFTSYVRQSVSFFLLGGILALHPAYLDNLKKVRKEYIALLFVFTIPLSMIDNRIVGRINIILFTLAVYVFCAAFSSSTHVLSFVNRFIPYSFFIYVTHGKILSLTQILAVRYIKNYTILCGLYLCLPFVIAAFCWTVGVLFDRFSHRLYAICTGQEYNNR